MEKVYLDCNVLLDWALQRKPFSDSASIIVALIETEQLVGVVSPLTLANTHYIARKEKGKVFAMGLLNQCQQLFEFCDNSAFAMQQAITHHYKDLEDDMHYFSAMDSGDSGVDTLITRNIKDFPTDGKVQIITPGDFLQTLGY